MKKKKISTQKKRLPAARPAGIPLKIKKDKSFPVVAIGASAGGLEAMTQLLKNLSPGTGMAYIYVQHLSPDHKSMLTALLSKTTKMKVQEIEDMEHMEPDNVYVIPHNKGIEVMDGHIQLVPREKARSGKLTIDVLFSSLAETHKENVIGIVLSGSAGDGTKGLKEIKLAGGITFAQDDSAKFSSMPKSAIAAGVVDFVMDPKAIAAELNWMSRHPLIKRNHIKALPEDTIENNDPNLKSIIQMLHKRKNIDFSSYKMNTVKRRMLRRMLIHKIKTIKEYAGLLDKKNNEATLLYQDLLINVTEFFRDTETFTFLKKTILPKLLKSKEQGETLRIWVAACATGEEVYSIAMLLLELQDNKKNNIPFQIFASDLSATAISDARNGEYSLQQLKNVSPKRLQRFFTKSKDKYRIAKPLRDVCVFASHNILGDPPFSRMDFISCRNFLIYLEPAAQKKAISTFHYSLNEGGCLLLGKSESTGSSAQLFTPLNKKFKVYSRKKNSGPQRIPDLTSSVSRIAARAKNTIKPLPVVKKTAASANGNLGSAFDAVLLSHYVPASVIINYDMEIMQFRGATSLYLQQSAGKASFNILKMAHSEITFELRNAIHHAIKTKKPVTKTGIEINRDGSTLQLVNIEVKPVKIEGEDPLLVIVFTGQQVTLNEHTGKNIKSNSIAKDRRIKKLEEELASARYDMGTITHDQESANEELQSANEEVVSSNEELQSLNEELETSKEEIESTNEELTTTNQEMQARMLQVEELSNYFEAILATVHEPVLILDKDMRIRSANKSFCKTFHVKEEECLGVSLYKVGNSQWNVPRLRELLEDIIPKNNHFQDFEVEHEFPIIGHKTMLLNAHRIVQKSQNEELIILTIADITDIKLLVVKLQEKEKNILKKQLEAEKKATMVLQNSEARYSNLIQNLPVAVYTCDKNGYVQLYNKEAVKAWGREPVIGKDRWCGSWKMFTMDETPLPLHSCPMAIALKEERAVGGEEFLIERPDGSRSTVIPNALPIFDEDGKLTGAINTIMDVTDQKTVSTELIEAKVFAELATEIAMEQKNKAQEATSLANEAVKAKQQFLANMSHEIRTPMNAIIGFTRVILKTDLTPKQKEYLSAIKMSGDALIVLINDILDLAKVDAGKMTFEQVPFKMALSISAMLHVFETKIQEKNLTLIKEYDTAIPEVLVGDPVRLHQVILNLVSNAVKFTSKGKITVSIRLLEETKEKATIEFAVTDTGIGIPKDRIETIFENFQQASSGTSRLYGGTGLGLAIVKQLVEPQGGTIKVESKVGKGTTFSFVLSFQKTKLRAEEIIVPGEQDAEIKNIKVLVVEDIALNQLLMKTLLEDFGFEQDLAENGKIAIELLKKKAYDIILMDLQMPEMNGFDATTYIRKTLKIKIPVIALTADVTKVDVEKCKAVGMNDYISKPVDEKLLYAKILALTKKPAVSTAGATIPQPAEKKPEELQLKYTDLAYLIKLTRSDNRKIMEMVSIYLKQTPPLISAMKQSLKAKDWELLKATVHKMLPSFSIMGIGKGYEDIAKKIQEYAGSGENTKLILPLVIQLETICSNACSELEEAFYPQV